MAHFSNTNDPKVSIIIPVYNVKQYLKDALNSVINQTYKNLEIIIIDDGSNDGSEIICKEYAQKDNRIKLIRRENGGLSAARNTGLDNMTGEYVAFLDSDDIFLPETIEKSLNTLLSNNVDCVEFERIVCKIQKNLNIKKLLNTTTKLKVLPGVYSREEALKFVANIIIAATVWNKFSKREIWNDLRFPEGHVYEDLYIIFQMISKIRNIYIMNEPLVLYRQRSGSINTDNSIKNTTDLLDSWTVFENFVENHIPELFGEEQIIRTDKKILTSLTLRYVRILAMHFPQKNEVLSLMKEKIKNLEKIVKIKNCSAKIRLLYYMIFNHQILLSIFFQPSYLLYKSIKNIIRVIDK